MHLLRPFLFRLCFVLWLAYATNIAHGAEPVQNTKSSDLSEDLSEESYSSKELLPHATWQLGVYKEWLSHGTEKNYDSSHSIGFLAELEQVIAKHWTGIMQLRWSDWKVSDSANSQNASSPIGAYSKVAYNSLLSERDLSFFVTGGAGYMVFIHEEESSWHTSRTLSINQEGAVTGGFGLRWVLNTSWLLKTGVEDWRSVDSNRYFGTFVYVSLGWGDAQHL